MNYYIANGTFYTLPSDDYLQHHGVKGMKWGKRKAKYETERAAYKQAKKDFRAASRELSRSSWTAVGRKGLSKYKSAEKKANKAELDMIDAKAKYKAAKAKTAEKAKKAEFNTYRKEMTKSGLVGSAADDASRGRSTRLYNHMKVSKGKKYADAVEKKVQNQAVATLATSAAVGIGAMVVAGILDNRY